MKKISFLIFLCVISFKTFSQEPSDAYTKVRRMMQEELNYTLASDGNDVQDQKQDTTTVKPVRNGIGPCMSLTSDTSPLIILNGSPIKPDALKKYDAKDIDSIKVIKDKTASAIYGSRASNGVILLYSRKK
ncbi:TonB-dependent receptor plug domain-containing protein [Sinomicrobium kalidii]|uniref:TonB-dependent receptor plug domain-containing protein n=1 Tax=Sinomicrobium kalidii TaxID=2900738 RepID=UPI001E2E4AC2|nr:TonB-dependent receptor plug domain-containing protein [Sinomicrobium kalidii]UGU17287.1 TonB-dependent receptor plug domain-containing protein [Sinomicrobium kalidii]